MDLILCSRQNSKITLHDTHPCSTSAPSEYGRLCECDCEVAQLTSRKEDYPGEPDLITMNH